MFFEYALDPRSIDNWPTLRYVSENFGPSRGRLLSKFPSNWAREASESVMARPGDKLRIVEKLRDIEKNLLRTKRSYNSDMSWISNALSIQPDEPFHAIIAKTDCDHPCFVHIDELDESNPLWKVGLDGKIKRNASEIARVASPLLSISAEAVLVDQHYSFTAKHGRPLAALIAAARNGKKLSRMEYHLNSEGDSLAFQVGLKKQLPYLDLKNEEEIIFVRWRRIDGGENMHPRYILTNRGGIRFDFGLDEGEGSTDYARLSEELWRQRWEQFKPDSQVLKLVDAWRAKMIPPPGSPTNNLVPSVKPVQWAETRWVES